ncbi:hypothetical protein BU14_0263s0009 [Porphyra umbilicalis]|uniref:Uncharacterized protein n=1 Tax=Porphyra umbilicalis TaxID=2786 RepID=A0A1X6P2K3_PORUM|nr:hypothetical protein BU14_0263s0009 [Porphyra umbilicalis]|eukprot:OSX74873.1 hypothetical protein BU14_0263s0009 [Porphyra umbilicalis]
MALIPRWRCAPAHVRLCSPPPIGAAFLSPFPPGAARPLRLPRGWRGGPLPRRGGFGGGGGAGNIGYGSGGGCGHRTFVPPAPSNSTRLPTSARLPWPMPSWRPRPHRSPPSPAGRGPHRERRRGKMGPPSGRQSFLPPQLSGRDASRASTSGASAPGGRGPPRPSGGDGLPHPPPPPHSSRHMSG